MRLQPHERVCQAVGRLVSNAFIKIVEIRLFLFLKEEGVSRKVQGESKEQREASSDEEEGVTRRKEHRGGMTDGEEGATRRKETCLSVCQ